MITSLTELYFRFRRFILLVEMKKLILKEVAAVQAAENQEMSETSPDTFNEGYIHQFHPEPTHRIH